ncbi:MAG TPA: serine hydrolase domain-containing protein [Vicinamibacterales bacterium]|nr:serine hydrolase domain-containing protein [Vicinamibacterales bacterium]
MHSGVLVATALTALAAAQLPVSVGQPVSGFNTGKLESIPAMLQAAVDAGELPGVVTLVWRNGRVAQLNAVGRRDIERGLPMTPDTIFRIASMSKPVTSAAALMLVDEGRLRLDDPITKWMPEFARMQVLRRPDGPLDDAFASPRVITIEDLLTHRSGLSYPFTAAGPLAAALEKAIGSEISSRLGPDEWLKALAALPLAYAPGERFHYGVSTDVLGFVVARASGMSLRDFLMSRVFTPLRMVDTDFWVPPWKRERLAPIYARDGQRGFRRTDESTGFAGYVGSGPPAFTSGGGGLVTTARDYLTFARMLLNGGEADGVRLLKPATVKLMVTNRLTPQQREIPLFGLPIWRSLGYGLGVSTIMNAEAYRTAGVGDGAEGAFGWPGSFGVWWQADPAADMVLLFLPQLSASLAEIQPAASTMRAFQRTAYAALSH